ncbi:MAG TPA: IPT/TIG domain-containing protein, partial [Myxococcales bacterium]|nr:IPT/TIG domain-containing protein [Myxococcales bacterium]
MRRAAPPRSSGLFPLALAALAASIALAACADRPPPQAVINDISPASGRVDQAQVVQINGANFGVRVFTDFNDPSQSHADDVYRVAVGGLSLTGVQHIDSTELTGTLPAGVPDGPNDVVVTDPWDRVSMLTGAYFGLPAGGPPTLLAITSGPANVPLLACAAATIQQRNAAGAPSVWITPTTITLATNPSASFGIFGDSSCSTAITSTTIDPGQTEVVVYVQSSTRRTASLVASGTGLAPASRSFVFGPTLLAFTTGPFTNIPLSVCTPFPIQVETRDPAGAPSAVNAPTAVTLAVAPTTGLSLYDTAGCNGGPVGQITIPTGASTAGFFF